jgi:hypothetical protein
MGFWKDNKDKLADVYQTATSHLEAVKIIRERYGIKSNRDTMSALSSFYKIEKPNIKHGGSCKKVE